MSKPKCIDIMTSPAEAAQKENLPYPVWEFNYKPERYVHESWVSNLPNAALLRKLITEDSSQQATRLSHHLMNQLGFNGKFYFDFKDPVTRLALWHGEDLKTLIYHVGILFFFDDIRKKITRTEVNQYRSELGAELYNFALLRAPKIKERQLKHLDFPASMSIKQQVLMAGLLSLFTAMQGYPLPLLKRFVIKLPRKWFDAYVHYSRRTKIPGGCAGNVAVIELMMNEVKPRYGLDNQAESHNRLKQKNNNNGNDHGESA